MTPSPLFIVALAGVLFFFVPFWPVPLVVLAAGFGARAVLKKRRAAAPASPQE